MTRPDRPLLEFVAAQHSINASPDYLTLTLRVDPAVNVVNLADRLAELVRAEDARLRAEYGP